MSNQYDHEDAELTGQLGSSNAPCDPKLLTIVQIGPPHLKSIQVLCTPPQTFFLNCIPLENWISFYSQLFCIQDNAKVVYS